MIKEHSAGAVIYRRKKFLLLYKKAHGIYKEGWYFVRGLIEKNETVEETVKREVYEETKIKDLNFVKGFKINTKWFYKNDKNELVFKTATYLLAGTNTKNVKLSYEHDDYGWFSYEQALDKLRFKNDKEVLGKAYSFIKENKV